MLKKQKSSLHTFMFSYLMILIPVIIIINMIFYFVFVPEYEKEIEAANNTSLQSYSILFDKFMMEPLDQIYLDIISDRYNVGFMDLFESIDNIDLWKVYEIHDELANMKQSYLNLIQSISIYYRESEYVISSNGFKNLKDNNSLNIFEYDFLELLGLGLQQKEKWIVSSEIVDYNTKERVDVISCIKRVPFVDMNSKMTPSLGEVVLSIKKDFIENDLLRNSKSDSFSFYIISKNGDFLYSSEDDLMNDELVKKIISKANNKEILHLKEDKDIISVVESDNSEIVYIFKVPASVYFEKSDLIRKKLLIIASIVLLLGLIMSYIISKRTYYPIWQVAQNTNIMLSRLGIVKNIEGDDIKKIEYTLSYLSNRIQRNMPILKYNLFNGMIRNLIEKEDIDARLDMLKIEKEFSFFSVAIIQNMNSNQKADLSEMARIAIVDYIDQLPKEDFYFYVMPLGNRRLTIVYFFNDKSKIYKQLKNIQFFIKKEEILKDSYMVITLGSFVENREELNICYKHAKELLPYSYLYSDEIIEYDKHIGLTQDYKKDDVNRLVEWLNLGQVEIIQKYILDYFQDAKDNRLEIEKIRKDLENITKTIEGVILRDFLSLVDKKKFEQKFKEIINAKNIEEFFDRLSLVLKDYCEKMDNKKANIMDDVLVNVIDYLENNLNQEISLRSLSEKFHISYSHLSKMFKQHTGVSFSIYMNNKRIAISKELLWNTNDSIDDIASKSGFNDTGYFIKQFKKKEGITPGQYRLNHSDD